MVDPTKRVFEKDSLCLSWGDFASENLLVNQTRSGRRKQKPGNTCTRRSPKKFIPRSLPKVAVAIMGVFVPLALWRKPRTHNSPKVSSILTWHTMERVRLAEDANLKFVGDKTLRGSRPLLSVSEFTFSVTCYISFGEAQREASHTNLFSYSHFTFHN